MPHVIDTNVMLTDSAVNIKFDGANVVFNKTLV